MDWACTECDTTSSARKVENTVKTSHVALCTRRLIENIGSAAEEVSAELLEKRVEYGAEHQSMQRTLAPGLSYISSHMARILYSLTKRQYEDRHAIWGAYRRGSHEKIIADEAILDSNTLLGQVQLLLDNNTAASAGI